jgi:hypothetical protein
MSDSPSSVGVERRRARRRRTIHDHGIVRVRARPGWEVSLLDVSAGGALVETPYRLLPGSSVELHVATLERRASVRGGVLRSSVVSVHASGVCYRSAIGFERLLSWYAEDDTAGYGVPGLEAHALEAGAATTPEAS